MLSRENQYLLQWNNACPEEYVSYQSQTGKLEVYQIRDDHRLQGARIASCVSSKEIPHINCLDFSYTLGTLSTNLAIGSTSGYVTLIDTAGISPDIAVNNQKKFGRYNNDLEIKCSMSFNCKVWHFFFVYSMCVKASLYWCCMEPHESESIGGHI